MSFMRGYGAKCSKHAAPSRLYKAWLGALFVFLTYKAL
ncbi:MAG: hypothetical protein BSOLF_2361 [Candidatus Carbobacillus altaicus]|uniref:Uncharacterized protein n=1 Tax=Candidatus Carbonibacillus altaicus TaxID=2163959 RepID=A0A2R6Y2P4_9BACL|nr:MAG: hypothetical protein BSOLF_2361 [Candidatus Carbobacillus altaicus]